MNKNEQCVGLFTRCHRAPAEIPHDDGASLLEWSSRDFFMSCSGRRMTLSFFFNRRSSPVRDAQAANLFGYSRAELLAGRLNFASAAFRESCDASNAIHRSGTEFQLSGCSKEIFALRKDGREFPAEFSVSLLKADGCSVFVNTIRDVSERHQTQQLLEDAYAKIEQLKQRLEQGERVPARRNPARK
jgi:PAS domain S-box-containing protein